MNSFNYGVILKIDSIILFCEHSKNVKTFRQPFYQTIVILVMLTSWIFMLASSTCVMPIAIQSPVINTAMPADCDDVSHHIDHQKSQAEIQKLNCLLKPCPDSKHSPAISTKIAKLDIPVFILCLIGLSTFLYNPTSFRVFRRWQSIDFANSIPIRYRFCVLLN